MDKSIEELTIELNELKRKNLEVETQREKEKLALAEEEKMQKEHKVLEEQIRSKVLQEFAEKSNIVSNDKPVEMARPSNDIQRFCANFAKKHGLTGRKYEDFITDKVEGGYK